LRWFASSRPLARPSLYIMSMKTQFPLMCAVSQDGRVRLFVVLAIFAVAAVVLLAASPAAYAYDPADPPTGRTCADCHGRQADENTDTVAPGRKGPHGGFNTATRKCAACHTVHGATADGYALLPGPTAKAVCESCHDGTGGNGVYGAITARGGEVRSAHRIEATNVVPGGDPTGGALNGAFSGPGETLTCVDCHSPHDSNTVAPFTGDRLRATDDAGSSEATNRLLRRLPGPDGTPVDFYGSDWCASCHAGYHLAENGIDPVTGTANRHPVGFESGGDWHYDRVRVVTSTNTSDTAWGSLGGSNAGFVMPHAAGDMLGFSGPQAGTGPLCQQCHEDARDVGGVLGGSPVLLPGQEFVVSGYGATDGPADNPRFQVFPHESDQPGFRVTRSDPDSPAADGFCLRCHVPGS
jgi:predicted CXXCH cytochrome family protein